MTLSLTNGEAVLLRSALSVPQTFSDIGQIFVVSKFCAGLPDLPKGQEEDALATWALECGDYEISEKARDLCKDALRKHADKLPVGRRETLALIEKFGLHE